MKFMQTFGIAAALTVTVSGQYYQPVGTVVINPYAVAPVAAPTQPLTFDERNRQLQAEMQATLDAIIAQQRGNGYVQPAAAPATKPIYSAAKPAAPAPAPAYYPVPVGPPTNTYQAVPAAAPAVPANSPAEVQEAAANILDLVKAIVPADTPEDEAKLNQITELTQEVVAKAPANGAPPSSAAEAQAQIAVILNLVGAFVDSEEDKANLDAIEKIAGDLIGNPTFVRAPVSPPPSAPEILNAVDQVLGLVRGAVKDEKDKANLEKIEQVAKRVVENPIFKDTGAYYIPSSGAPSYPAAAAAVPAAAPVPAQAYTNAAPATAPAAAPAQPAEPAAEPAAPLDIDLSKILALVGEFVPAGDTEAKMKLDRLAELVKLADEGGLLNQDPNATSVTFTTAPPYVYDPENPSKPYEYQFQAPAEGYAPGMAPAANSFPTAPPYVYDPENPDKVYEYQYTQPADGYAPEIPDSRYPVVTPAPFVYDPENPTQNYQYEAPAGSPAAAAIPTFNFPKFDLEKALALSKLFFPDEQGGSKLERLVRLQQLAKERGLSIDMALELLEKTPVQAAGAREQQGQELSFAQPKY